jgi:hypothetical protein
MYIFKTIKDGIEGTKFMEIISSEYPRREWDWGCGS